MKIKFGTDGWRAIIAREYTVENVQRVAEGTALWMKANAAKKVVIGHDCRFGGEMFAEAAARVLAAHGLEVALAKGFVSTPMVSLGVVKANADLGVVITASHNPPTYNGFKLKSKLGGPMIPKEVAEVEELIPDDFTTTIPTLTDALETGKVQYIDLEEIYIQHVEANFDLAAIHALDVKIAYDAMYGAGKNAVKRLLPDAILLHDDDNPGFHGRAPEPIHRNLGELSALIAQDDSITIGFANDGDADRIGMYNSQGEFVDSHHILLLLLLYMAKYKEETGKVIFTFSVTDKMRNLAEHFGLDYEITKIGFKYIAEIMAQEDVIVGGEESGGLAIKGHVPERDGVWIALTILEFMAKTGKSLEALIEEVYGLVGSFAFDRYDLHITPAQKQQV
ncbi:MAG: phosphoglucomutase/phosphomannomutase family protein, partial [Bacteroidota bacterium]